MERVTIEDLVYFISFVRDGMLYTTFELFVRSKRKCSIVGNGHVKGGARLMKLKIRWATDKVSGTKMITSLK